MTTYSFQKCDYQIWVFFFEINLFEQNVLFENTRLSYKFLEENDVTQHENIDLLNMSLKTKIPFEF